jgi:hypothetical protein
MACGSVESNPPIQTPALVLRTQRTAHITQATARRRLVPSLLDNSLRPYRCVRWLLRIVNLAEFALAPLFGL